MANEVVLSWDIHSLSVTTITKFFFKRDAVQHHTLLNNVSGYAKSGSLLAIMGPSGAGKTTLLATLSQRMSGQLTGAVMLNGRAIDKELMARISGFVSQKDLAVPSLTALEQLNFMASLTLDRRVSVVQQQRIIFGLINDLGLSSCSLTQISALSGGERKRLSLAVQMITDPPIMFCDEPTTGLDSYHASSVVTLLRQLTARGKLVVCSIHQPASDVFLMFDQLCLLAPGGRLAYFGNTYNAQPYFASLGMECPDLYNPADFFLCQLNGGPKETRVICAKFGESEQGEALVSELEDIRTAAMKNEFIYGIEEKFFKFYSVQPPSQQTQLSWLMWRSALATTRDSQRIMLRFIMYMMIGVLISTPYVTVELNQAGIQNLQGFHYAIITETIFSHSYAVLHTFPAEITIMLREINNGVYHPGPYYFAKAFVLIPLVVLETFMFCMIAFFVVGVEGGSLGLIMFSTPAIASAIVSTAYGCCISAMFEDVASASLLIVPVDVITYTFSGMFLGLETVPFFLRWVKYTSRFYYGFEAMSILQWRQVESISCPENSDVPCILSGSGVLDKYGFSPYNLPIDFLGLLLSFAALHVVGFFALKRRSKQNSVY